MINNNINNANFWPPGAQGVDPHAFQNIAPAVPVKPSIPMTYDFTKAGKNGTLITVILDESGSMNGVREQTISAFNEFVIGQKAASATSGKGFLTLMKFEAPNIITLYSGRPLDEVPVLTHKDYTPRGGTNLLDAVGEAMSQVDKHLQGIEAELRPGVMTVIMTDGEENSSRNFVTDEIKKMVKAAETNADWTFTFLGANIDAFAASSSLGMGHHNTMQYNAGNMAGTMAALSDTVTAVRSAKVAGISTMDIYATGLYTDEQRDKAK